MDKSQKSRIRNSAIGTVEKASRSSLRANRSNLVFKRFIGVEIASSRWNRDSQRRKVAFSTSPILGVIRVSGFVAILFLLFGNGSIRAAQDSLKVGRHVIAAGGGSSSTTEFKFNGSIGQTGIGRALTSSYQVFSGFWQGLPQGCCVGVTGDMNYDGRSNTILDLNFLVNQIFRGGLAPLCLKEGDLDGNGTPSQILDLNAMVNKIFRGGPEPAQCM